jgi:hypothetical protein
MSHDCPQSGSFKLDSPSSQRLLLIQQSSGMSSEKTLVSHMTVIMLRDCRGFHEEAVSADEGQFIVPLSECLRV